MQKFLTILGGFFLTMYFLGAAGALDFRVCVGKPGTCSHKSQ